MNFIGKSIKKIFPVLNFGLFFKFSKLTPQEKLTNLIDKLLEDVGSTSYKNIPTLEDQKKKMYEIQYEYIKSLENPDEKLSPKMRLKKFKEKMKKKIGEFELKNNFMEGNEDLKKEIKIDENEMSASEFSEEESLKNAKNNDKPNSTEDLGNSDKINEKAAFNDSNKNKAENMFEVSTEGLKYIPENLIIKTLVFPHTETEVLLLGVEKRNENHASFMIGFLNLFSYFKIL